MSVSDFYKIGGYPVLSKILPHKSAEIRWKTLELIAVLVQNHTYCQEMALKENLLPKMLTILDTDDDSTVKIKALYAVSCKYEKYYNILSPRPQRHLIRFALYDIFINNTQGTIAICKQCRKTT